MTHYEEAMEYLENAQELASDGKGHLCDRCIKYAKVEATLAIVEELRLARERKAFMLPSNSMVNLDKIQEADWKESDLTENLLRVYWAGAIWQEEGPDWTDFFDADADALAEALGMTKKETE